MKALKYEHQSIFPLWGRLKLNFRDRYRKPNIYSKNSSCYQFFSSNSQKNCHFGVRKKTITHPDAFVYLIYGLHMIPWGNYNFARSTNKIHFSMNFPHLEKNCRFNESPQI